MSEEPLPLPDEPAPPPDPFEAELVAYLDGELEPVAARTVEARLAKDPAARRKAAELQKTFELLDFLPKPEPSANFTTRTLDRLPAVAPSATPALTSTPAVPASGPSLPVVNPNVPASASASLSVPVALTNGSRAAPTPPALSPRAPRRGLWVAGILVAVCACGAAGYAASALLRPRPPQNQTPAVDDLAIADYRVVENLPLYAAVDDIEYARELAAPDLFGDEPAVATDWKVPAVESDKPSAPAFAKQAQAFKAMPLPRQEALRELDRQLGKEDAATRDRLVRVLEVYALWVDRLPEGERKVVFGATDGKKRLDEVRRLRNDQWVESLPAPQKAELRKLPTQQQADRILKWREEEAARRDDWAFVRKYAPDILDNKNPWPFDSTARQKEIVEFMRVAYRTDDDKKCRFSEYELTRYKAALAVAEKTGGWLAWYAYGKLTYDLTRKYETYPEPMNGEAVTRPDHLPKNAERHFDKGPGLKATQDKVGKWPDFALAVHTFAVVNKGDRIPLGTLGPAKPSDFKEPLRTFVTTDLSKVLNSFEKKELTGSEGQWPRYPQEVLKLSRGHDLVAPGLMLPGSPRQWEKMYGSFRLPGMPGGFGPRP